MISGMTSAQPESARGTIGISSSMPTVSRPDPSRMMLAGRRRPTRLPARIAVAEHRQRQRRERQAGLHGVVLQDHLQVDRQGDHRPSQRDVLEHLP